MERVGGGVAPMRGDALGWKRRVAARTRIRHAAWLKSYLITCTAWCASLSWPSGAFARAFARAARPPGRSMRASSINRMSDARSAAARRRRPAVALVIEPRHAYRGSARQHLAGSWPQPAAHLDGVLYLLVIRPPCSGHTHAAVRVPHVGGMPALRARPVLAGLPPRAPAVEARH